MMYTDRTYTLRDGLCITVGGAFEQHVLSLIDFVRSTTKETPFLGRTEEDLKKYTEEYEREWLRQAQSNPDRLYLFAKDGDDIIGVCDVKFNTSPGTRHRASMGLAVLQEYWGCGLGSLFMELAIRAAKERYGVERLELNVYEENFRALKLYERYGFRIVNTYPDAFRLDDRIFLNSISMALSLKE